MTHFGNDGRTLSEHGAKPVWGLADNGGPVAFGQKGQIGRDDRSMMRISGAIPSVPVHWVKTLSGDAVTHGPIQSGPNDPEPGKRTEQMLTRKQLQLLEFINTRMHKDGVPPSFDEMKEALDLRSKSGIHRLITALEERGFIRRLAHRARAIEIVKLPESMGGPSTAPTSAGFSPRVIDGDRPNSPPPSHALDVEVVSAINLPIMGKIAAGVPIEAVSDGAMNVAVPGSMLSGRGNHYALEVKGESMIEAGINHGDIVVIRETSNANNGDIVVAMVEGYETTLKRYKRQGDMVALEAANPAFETRVLPAHQVEVQGKLVGLIRSY